MTTRVKSRGPEIVIAMAGIGFLALVVLCIYVRGCGSGTQTPVFAQVAPRTAAEIAKTGKPGFRPTAAAREISGGVAASVD
jgi:hypothetical protein